MIGRKECAAGAFPQNAAVACQGVRGAYSEVAAQHLFAHPDILYMRTFDGVFRAVETGLCQYGILPIENSNAGSVADVYDLMKVHNFFIVRSVKVSIFHKLLVKEKTNAEDLAAIYTHEQAVKQCSRFLEKHPHIEINVCANTAKAAQLVAQSDRSDIAAIASGGCAELYTLTALTASVQNSENNYTRFICISKQCEVFDGADKISLMLTLEHKAGSLYEAIKQFAEAQINLTKLESRPIADTDFEFMFYFDLQARVDDKQVHDVLRQVERSAKQFVFLGNYQEIIA
jgi:chorismate mutase/prephenate dehydratase